VGQLLVRWENNIKVDIKETRCDDVDRIQLAADRAQWLPVMNMIMNFWVPTTTRNLLTPNYLLYNKQFFFSENL
jgi:hypothetical protein